MVVTCPICVNVLDDISFLDIYDPETGSSDRYISCFYCGYEEYEDLKKQEVPF